MVRQEEGGKRAAILERRGPPPLAKKMEEEEEKPRIYAQMPDGSLLFNLAQLPEIIKSYEGYFR